MVWPLIAGLGAAYLGYRSAQDRNKAIQKQNEIQQKLYEQSESERLPGIEWSQSALNAGRWIDAEGNPVAEGTPGAQWQSAFSPFIGQQGQTSLAGQNIANQYLANVPYYQQAGLRGLASYGQLADVTPEDIAKLGDYYTDRYGQGAYDIAAKDIGRQAYGQRQNLADITGRGGALSTAKSKADSFIEQARQEALLKAGERAQQVGYDRAQAEYNRQLGLTGQLTSLGTSGLSQAQQASQLGYGAFQAGVAAPFAPASAYGSSIGALPGLYTPQFGQTVDPLSTGIGFGLQAYDRFR